MKPLALLVIVFILTGCVIYPARHVSEPRYEVLISGDDFNSVQLTSSLDAKAGTCNDGKNLNPIEPGTYSTEAEYGWLKAAFMVPVDSYKPIKICAITKDNREYYWEENIGVFGNDYPKVWKFKCEVIDRVLDCEKTT